MTRGVPIRVLVAAIAVLPAAGVAAVLVVLLTVTGREVSERLGETMLSGAAARVRSDVGSFLGEAVRVSDLYARRAEGGVLPLAGLTTWERPQLDDLVVSPGVASVSFGSASGETTWVLRHAGRLEVGRVGSDGAAVEYVIDAATGAVGTDPLRTYIYDPRARPWYAAALAAGKPVWTPIYFWFGDGGADSETGTGYTRPITGADGQVAGVLVVDVTLGGLSQFLRSLPVARSGAVFLVDDQGLLVAASAGAVNSAGGERLALAASEHPAARQAAAALGPGVVEQTLRLDVDGAPTRIRVSPVNPYPGVAWRLVAAVPESAFLGEAHALQRRALWASGGAVAVALVFGVLLARRLSGPIMTLADHVRRVGGGDFESRLNLRAAREFRALSEELNRMAGGLKQRMELEQSLALAMQVQQSLLPHAAPKVGGIDIAGQSRYCDATGGDYFDFIDASGLPGGQVLVAVGDVMGHGIASALLMATARGALRARAADGVPLGALMTRVNAVLAKDAAHRRFMTMILMVLDPAARTMRWASAGHDPPLIYDPDAGRFTAVEGGHIPLGIDEFAEYEEYVVRDLPPRAVVVIGTDGIWEAANRQDALFGHERLRDVIRRSADRPSAEILREIDNALGEHCAGRPALDDITAVVVRMGVPPGPPEPRPA